MAGNTRHGVVEELRRGREEASGVMTEVADIAKEFQTLFQQEVELAKAEVSAQVRASVQATIWGVGAALFGFLMLIFVFTGVMLVLGDELFDLWIAGFITAGIAGVLAVIAAVLAMSRVRKLGAPEKTIESFKEDLQWAGTQVRSSKT